MKAVFSNVLLFVMVAFAGARAFAQTAENTEPSYADTVDYIQKRLRPYSPSKLLTGETLQEESRCHFILKEHIFQAPPAEYHFNAADLSLKVEHSFDYSDVLRCWNKRACVHWHMFNNSIDKNDDIDSVRFPIERDIDLSKMDKAFLHLLDLCGARPEKPDLF
jgi:hypothetical protein